MDTLGGRVTRASWTSWSWVEMGCIRHLHLDLCQGTGHGVAHWYGKDLCTRQVMPEVLGGSKFTTWQLPNVDALTQAAEINHNLIPEFKTTCTVLEHACIQRLRPAQQAMSSRPRDPLAIPQRASRTQASPLLALPCVFVKANTCLPKEVWRGEEAWRTCCKLERLTRATNGVAIATD